MTRPDIISSDCKLLFQCRPVNWIEVTGEFIFVVEGPGLSVYTVFGQRLCQKLVLPHNKIVHGLAIFAGECTDVIFVYGSRFSTIVTFDRTSEIQFALPASRSLNVEDIYLAAVWLSGGRKLAAITDENVVHVFSWVDGATIQDEIRGVQTSLFSATLSGQLYDNLIVFGGTNLSQIYVWAPSDLKRSYCLLIEGVKGSVLSLKYCSENQILIASSDQRSVFAWKLNFDANTAKDLCEALKTRIVSVSLICEMVGHTGRVWDVDISGEFIVSAGQDSNLLLWNIAGKLIKMSSGSSIVSLRSCKITADRKFVICGSDDGSVCRWSLSDNNTMAKFSFSETNSADYPRQVLCYSRDLLLVSLSSGTLLAINVNGEKRQVFCDANLASYNVCAISPIGLFIAIGSRTGLLYVLRVTRDDLDACEKPSVLKLDSKIVSLNWILDSGIIVGTCSGVYLVEETGPENIPSVQVNTTSQKWKVSATFQIEWKDKPGVAAAIKLKSESGKYVVAMGDEWGGLHLFEMQTDVPVLSLAKVHGNYGICDLKHGQRESELWSVGRNRSIMNLKLNEDPWELLCVQTIDSCLNWNSKLIRNPSLGSFVCGFAENDFVVMDLVEDRIVKKFPCGGAHRSWDVVFDDIISFAFIRQKELTVARFGVESFFLKSGLYGGKTINVVIVIQNLGLIEANGGDGFCLLTSGEDGVLRLSQICVYQNEGEDCIVTSRKLARFKGHASSVRAIKHHPLNKSSAVVFSAGGRSQIVASCIQSFSNTTVWTKKSSVMLQASNGNGQDDPDMRIMDVSIRKVETESLTFEIVCACSDGFLRLLKFRDKFILISTFSHLFKDNPPKDTFHSVSAVSTFTSFSCWTTSSGELALSEDPLANGVNQCFVANDAAITTMAALPIPETSAYLIVTGADDGSVQVFKTVSGMNVTGDLVHNLQNRHVHHAAVNAVKIFRDFIFAVSADQVLSIRTHDGRSVKKFVVGVSDVQDLEVTPHPLVSNSVLLVLVGQGLEICSVDLTNF